MKYGIFRISEDKSAGLLTISLTAVADPADSKKALLVYDNDSPEFAAQRASELLKSLGIRSTTYPETPKYFIGVEDGWGHVYKFVPVLIGALVQIT